MMRILLAAFLLSLPTAAWPQSSANPELEREVQNALATAGFAPEAINVSTRGATVVLQGKVRDARQKLLAIETAFGVAAVQEVETALELTYSATPEVEEEAWFAVLAEGLDAGVDTILVEEGVARVEAPAVDEKSRERLRTILEGVQGVRAVTFGAETMIAEAPPGPPAPSPVAEAAVEDVAEVEEPAPPPADRAAAEIVVKEPEPELPPEPNDAVTETSSDEPAVAAVPEPPEVEEHPASEPIAETPADKPEPVTETAEGAEVEEPEEEVIVAPTEPLHVPEPSEPDVREPGAPSPVPETLSAPAGAPSPADLVSPTEIELRGRDIVEQILTYPEYTVFDHIQLGMQQGVVKLVGFVTEASKKEEIGERVASVAGSLRIENEIRVLLDSSSDDTLRTRLFQRIYQNPTFAAFADSENPPVHIIVEGGGVILTGVVDRQIDASVAETIARNTFGVRRVENRLRVATSIASP